MTDTRRYAFQTVDVFTDRRFGGNPLAVFPDARGLSDVEMQAIANELNLSETTFVLPPDDVANTARVRIFNRTKEMPFAGHPNVGTAFVLARERGHTNGTMRFEELAGRVDVRLERGADGSVSGATIDAPQPLTVGMAIPVDEAAACVGLTAGDIVVAAHEPIWASIGNPYIIVEVTSGALAAALPDVSAFRATLAARPALKGRLAFHIYARGEPIRARMFSPLAGTFEDPATGSANAPLAALLLSLSGRDSARYDIVQGVEMGRPSLLRTTAARQGTEIRATVGGSCVPVYRGAIEL